MRCFHGHEIEIYRGGDRLAENIYKYYCLHSARAAAVIHNDILDRIDRLVDAPRMGPLEQTLTESPQEYRSLIVRRKWKVIYRIEKQTLYITDIRDCRQDPQTLKKRVIER